MPDAFVSVVSSTEAGQVADANGNSHPPESYEDRHGAGWHEGARPAGSAREAKKYVAVFACVQEASKPTLTRALPP